MSSSLVWVRNANYHELFLGPYPVARIKRVAPYYRVRLLGAPGARVKRAASLRAARSMSEDWAREAAIYLISSGRSR